MIICSYIKEGFVVIDKLIDIIKSNQDRKISDYYGSIINAFV